MVQQIRRQMGLLSAEDWNLGLDTDLTFQLKRRVSHLICQFVPRYAEGTRMCFTSKVKQPVAICRSNKLPWLRGIGSRKIIRVGILWSLGQLALRIQPAYLWKLAIDFNCSTGTPEKIVYKLMPLVHLKQCYPEQLKEDVKDCWTQVPWHCQVQESWTRLLS